MGGSLIAPPNYLREGLEEGPHVEAGDPFAKNPLLRPERNSQDVCVLRSCDPLQPLVAGRPLRVGYQSRDLPRMDEKMGHATARQVKLGGERSKGDGLARTTSILGSTFNPWR